MNTDHEWEKWAQKDPFFAVLSTSQFRSENLNAERKKEFFDLGQTHFDAFFRTCCQLDPGFRPRRALEFGCGLGRLLIPMSKVAGEVVGLDIADSMLKTAATHCAERGIKNATFLHSDDALSLVQGKFDLILSFIVFQHLPVKRGYVIFSQLLDRLADGGIAAIHLTYGREGTSQLLHAQALRPLKDAVRMLLPFLFPDPEMQMNCYRMETLLKLAQSKGVPTVHLELSHAGSFLTAMLYCQKPKAPTPAEGVS